MKCSKKWLFKWTVTLTSNKIQGNIPLTYTTRGHVTLSLENDCKTGAAEWAQCRAWEWTAFTLKLYFFFFLPAPNIKCDRFEVCGLELSWDILFHRSLVDRLMHATSRTNLSVNRFLALMWQWWFLNKPHYDSVNRNLVMLTESNRRWQEELVVITVSVLLVHKEKLHIFSYIVVCYST